MKRRELMKTVGLGAAAAVVAGRASPAGTAEKAGTSKKIRVGVIGCGSVSRHYLPDLKKRSFVELVSVCDIIYDRAKQAAARYGVPNHYPHIDKMLAGAEFDLLVNLTDMQEHCRLSTQAIAAGKHVWSEKPMAVAYEDGKALLELARKKGVRIMVAPTVVTSPQFAFMAETVAGGALGRIAAAHASYGHLGPNWSPFFYDKGGGSMPDLGVYNVTTLTGLLGPAREVAAMTSIVTPTRRIRKLGSRQIKVQAEDNTMLLMDHGGGTLSHVQCGFNYFTAQEHGSGNREHHTIDIVGTGGSMHLAGYDWAPLGVDLATRGQRKLQRHAAEAAGYTWQHGASHMAECLAANKKSPIAPEHALHVVEVIAAANESQRTGRRIRIKSTFKWPIVGPKDAARH